MKKIKVTFYLLFVLCLALALTLTVSCAGSPAVADSGPATSGNVVTVSGSNAAGQVSSQGEVKVLGDVEGKEWMLTELRSGANTVRIDRSKLGGADTNGSFTIIFQDSRVNGVGWPNRYFGPYTAGSGDALTISDQLASTMMAAFIELDELKEYDYFAYLSKVTRWAVRDGRLELYSTTDGRETTLVFELR
ncbi:MAG: META domain-containing protein [Treponema sp.]|jgi:hypothetical protein|nr:META domain-containing protein [Treponema sp.]